MNEKLGLVTGSFDPITVGHLDIVTRAAKIFDRVIVVVANNDEKQYMFSIEERVAIAEKAVEGINGVTVMRCDGLVADFAVAHGADAFVRGIRGGEDVAYEQHMADVNFASCGVDTVMLFAKPQYHTVSSTKVRAALKNQQGIDAFMPVAAATMARELLDRKS
ncbi:MAG: pantetheine-phosphate adenylyltransferase [Clostridia bacterium]|nr:pantetheine-phosphate adenylyltransferase [Clostridia bacterium]